MTALYSRDGTPWPEPLALLALNLTGKPVPPGTRCRGLVTFPHGEIYCADPATAWCACCGHAHCAACLVPDGRCEICYVLDLTPIGGTA